METEILMDARRTYREGLTTVELLIVMAIVGLLATMTIPVALQFAGSPNRSVAQGARDLYTVLRAAKIYATTHNVETAVAYVISPKADSTSSGTIRYAADKFVVVRQIKREELELDNQRLRNLIIGAAQARFGSVPAEFDAEDDVFVSIKNDDGVTKFSNDTCLVSDETYGSGPFDGSYLRRYAMRAIFILDEAAIDAGGTGFLVPPGLENLPVATADATQNLQYAFPANVFTPGGEVLASQTVQRVVLRMALSPDADPADREQRIADPDSGLEVEIHSRVELYTAQGRVKISS